MAMRDCLRWFIQPAGKGFTSEVNFPERKIKHKKGAIAGIPGKNHQQKG
jgi:hypothetical protein